MCQIAGFKFLVSKLHLLLFEVVKLNVHVMRHRTNMSALGLTKFRRLYK